MKMLAMIISIALTLASFAKCEDAISSEKSSNTDDNQSSMNQSSAKPEEKHLKEIVGEEIKANQRYLLLEMLPKTVTNPKSAGKLSLTKEQTEKLQLELGKIKSEIEKFKVELEKSAVKQAKLITNNPTNEEELMAAVETTGKIRTDIAKLQIKQVLVVLKTLTPEQIEKAKQIVSRHRKTAAGNEPPSKGKGKSKGETKPEELQGKESGQSDQ